MIFTTIVNRFKKLDLTINSTYPFAYVEGCSFGSDLHSLNFRMTYFLATKNSV